MSDDRHSEQWLARARDRLVHGDLKGGIALLRRVLADEPDHAIAHALLSLCLVDLRLLRPARVEAEAAVLSEPELALTHHAMGVVLQAERKLDAAEESFRHALSLEPDDADRHVRLIRFLRMRGRRDQELLDEAIELAPDDPDVLVCWAYDFYDRRELADAEEHAREALEEDPEHVGALVAMGWIRLAEGNVADAHEHARMALHADPTDDDALALLAGVKARKNPVIGLWWRWSMWMSSFGDSRSIAILIVMFVTYRLVKTIADDFGYEGVAAAVSFAWLAFVAYSWVAPAIWRRMLKKDVDPVTLRTDY